MGNPWVCLLIFLLPVNRSGVTSFPVCNKTIFLIGSTGRERWSRTEVYMVFWRPSRVRLVITESNGRPCCSLFRFSMQSQISALNFIGWDNCICTLEVDVWFSCHFETQRTSGRKMSTAIGNHEVSILLVVPLSLHCAILEGSCAKYDMTWPCCSICSLLCH